MRVEGRLGCKKRRHEARGVVWRREGSMEEAGTPGGS